MNPSDATVEERVHDDAAQREIVEESLVEELLVEEVSIDGMCGVY